MKIKNFLQNIFDRYVGIIENSIYPKESTWKAKMNIEIKKGEKEGRVIVPCSILTISHSTDLNPSLIRKKDKKIIKNFSVEEKINYDPKTQDVILTKEEKDEGYKLEELESCKKCGQKTVIAELSETSYKSCPEIKVKLADETKEDLVVPVWFGIRKSQVYCFIASATILFGIGIYLLFSKFLVFSYWNGLNFLGMMIFIPVLLIFYFFFIPMNSYRAIMLYKWYRQIYPTLEKIK